MDNLVDYQKVLTNSYEKKQLKNAEIDTLKRFINELLNWGIDIEDLDGFFYGFSIPQISKEFDLLKIFENDVVVNIELKSHDIDLDKIEYQLRKNRYYLSHLKKKTYSFTYINSGEKGKIYSYDGDKLFKSNIEEIAQLISLKGMFSVLRSEHTFLIISFALTTSSTDIIIGSIIYMFPYAEALYIALNCVSKISVRSRHIRIALQPNAGFSS